MLDKLAPCPLPVLIVIRIPFPYHIDNPHHCVVLYFHDHYFRHSKGSKGLKDDPTPYPFKGLIHVKTD